MQFISKPSGNTNLRKVTQGVNCFTLKTKVKECSQKKVQMMDLTETLEFADLPAFQSAMLRLPYQGDRIVMDILLPNQKMNEKTWPSKHSNR